MAASPLSYSKTCDTFRPRARTAARAGLGGKRFIDLIEPRACVSAFVPKHGPERRPPSVEHRLAVLGPSQGGGVHVADEDGPILAGETGAQLVQEILPTVCDLGMQRLDAGSFARSLSDSKRRFQIAVEPLGLDILQAGGRRSRQKS